MATSTGFVMKREDEEREEAALLSFLEAEATGTLKRMNPDMLKNLKRLDNSN